MDGGLVYQLAGFLIAAGAVYGGIRSDLKTMHERIQLNESAISDLHRRIDDCVHKMARRSSDD